VPAKPKRAKSKSTTAKSTPSKSTPTGGTAMFQVKDLMVGVLPATVVCGGGEWKYNSLNKHWTQECRAKVSGGNAGCKPGSCGHVNRLDQASDAERATLKKHLKVALKALG
jgi:hypothetical protein